MGRFLGGKGQAERPWLTIILDEYSRAVAGYFLTFQAPSTIQTALALHQAIWRKSHPDWTICGILFLRTMAVILHRII